MLKFRDRSLPLEERLQALVDELTLEEKANQLVMDTAAIPRLGIGAYHWWSEALHGFARAGEATVFPQAIGLAASWSPDLLRMVGDVASTEGRAKFNEELRHHDGNSRRYHGVTIWSPNINIFRDPRWGRGQETYGEDPFLTAALGNAFVRGIQGDHPDYLKAVATLKHFAVHSGPEGLRHEFDARVSEKDLHDTYLPAFEACIRTGGAHSVMSAYSAFDGVPCCASQRLLTDILRSEWGFDGAVVGDVDNVEDLYHEGGHGYAKSGPEGIACAIKAGNDLRSGGYPEHAIQAIEQGLLTQSELDQALKRLLTLRFKLGHFDAPEQLPWYGIGTDVVRSQAHISKSYRAAKESLVLLKNDGILPLQTDLLKTVAVMGPTADDMDVLEGNYAGTPYEPVTILQGIKGVLEPRGITILNESGIPYAEGDPKRGMPIPNGVFFQDDACLKPGLLCAMYNGESATGDPILDDSVNHPFLEWNGVLPRPSQLTEKCATVMWSGFLNLPEDGEYTFHLRLHGAMVMHVDGEPVLSHTEDIWITHLKHTVRLSSAKPVPIQVTWTQRAVEGYFAMDWVPPDQGQRSNDIYDRAAATARSADLIILCLGLTYKLEGEEMYYSYDGFFKGDRTTIALPAPQKRLLDVVSETGKPIVLLLSGGSGIAFEPEKVNAVMQTWYYGAQGGRAIADALTGAFSPSGKLPITMYRRDADLPAFEDYAMKGRTYRYFEGEALYPFGFGLSYTSFAYSDMKVTSADDGFIVGLKVTNTGNITSDEIVQVYASREDRADDDPMTWLVGFEKAYNVRPGESRAVSILVASKWLALWDDKQRKRIIQPGKIVISAGKHSRWLERSDHIDVISG